MAQAYEINLVSLIEDFGSEYKCRQYLHDLRWPNGITCPRCDHKTISHIMERDQYDCDGCRYQFSVTSNTVMHDTHLPLWKWFLAVYLMVESKKGVSANQLKRSLKVQYRTAWYLCHRIRSALHTPHALLSGVVEVDEAFLGGRKKGVGQGTHGEHKTMVLGAKQRGGKIAIEIAKDRKSLTFREFIKTHVSKDAEFIYTDSNKTYGNLSNKKTGTKHKTVNHSAKEWVRGDVHVNGIEGAWCLFKRSVIGAYHKISTKHLDAYIDEFQFRFNNRDNPFIFRDAMKELLRAQPVEYKELVAEPAA